MSILVQVPPTFIEERTYIWTVLVQEFLGISVTVEVCDQAVTVLSVPGTAGRVVVADGFFAMPEAHWLTAASLPAQPVSRLDIPSDAGLSELGLSDIVSLYGQPGNRGPAVRTAEGVAAIDFDLAGSAFCMLTRYEEAVGEEMDDHARFPSSAMLAVKEGFSDRPVVNEYVELLHACLMHVWPTMTRIRRDYSVALSHDVDSIAFHKGAGPRQLASAFAGDLVQRRDLGLAARRAGSFFSRGARKLEADPYNTFGLLMDVSERHGLRSAFYFIAGGHTRFDANYAIDEPYTREVLGKIIVRDHEVGLHPSYGTPTDGNAIRSEFAALRDSATGLGSSQRHWGGRQHYLRWSANETWRHWADAGLDYDSSIGFPDRPGFRAACCFEYSTYDLAQRRPLALIERPLIVMEKTAFGRCTTVGQAQQGIDACSRLAAVVKRFNGCFTLLWHNSKIVSRLQRDAYQLLVEAVR